MATPPETEKIVYQSERFFREGESFRIVPFAEAAERDKVVHAHDFVEICYVCAGSGYHQIGDRLFRVAKGDLFLINYDVAHAFFRGDEDAELRTYNLLFQPCFLDESLLPFHDFSSLTMSYLFKDEWDDDLVRADLRLDPAEQREFGELIETMHAEYEARQSGHTALLRAYMIQLIVKLMRALGRRADGDERQVKKASLIENALHYLDEHYHEPIGLVDLARRSFLSKNYFCRVFKEATGMTVSQYIQQTRVEEACRLIRETDRPIHRIAHEVGYGDYKAFYSAFRKMQGCSPDAYRKRFESGA